ncbi:hypothetical protein LTR24_002169 [Lithohypha guttulata]|uniref:Uncharacterized protein n=1 Tax=Lithohypha guttulata TaxID=1690604 RepID=A0ABR0KIQ5_9EURO|nr:hypothetical protein LTR24_002169 [Lithohypha guttulata]
MSLSASDTIACGYGQNSQKGTISNRPAAVPNRPLRGEGSVPPMKKPSNPFRSEVGSGLPEKFKSPRGTMVYTKPVRVEGHDSRLKKVADNSDAKGAGFATRGLGPNKELKAPRDPPDHVHGNNQTGRRTPPQNNQNDGGPFRGIRARTHGVSKPHDELIGKRRKTLTDNSRSNAGADTDDRSDRAKESTAGRKAASSSGKSKKSQLLSTDRDDDGWQTQEDDQSESSEHNERFDMGSDGTSR